MLKTIANKLSLTFIFISMMTWLPSCGSANDNQKQSIVVINVLDKQLYDDCHIPHSIQLSMDDVDTYAQTIDKDTEIVIHCSNYMCTSSDYVAAQFAQKGFTKVYVYEAGIAEWYQQGYPVEGTCKSKYLQKVMERPDEQRASNLSIISTHELAQKLKLNAKK